VTSDVSQLTGLPLGTPVIIGGMDSMCAALGSGVLDESTVFDIGGSAGGLASVSTRLHADARFLNIRYILPGHWASIGPLSVAGNAWKWLQGNWLESRFSSDELLERAGKIPPGSEGVLFLPYLAGVRSPHWDMSVQATFHGITIHHNVGHLARSVLEGVTFSQKEVLAGLLEMGYTPNEIRVAGGGASNNLWIQMKTDALNIPHITLDTQEASAFGAALLAAYNIGVITDISQAVKKAGSQNGCWKPRPEIHKSYHESYLQWSKLKNWMFALHHNQ
jgi:xylulokinase